MPGTEVEPFGSTASSRAATIDPPTRTTQGFTARNSSRSASTSVVHANPANPAAERQQPQPVVTAASTPNTSVMATQEGEMNHLAGETNGERAPIASNLEERELWDNGEPVTQAEREKVLGLGSDYEKSREMNIIRNSRLMDDLGLSQDFADLFKGHKGEEVGKSSGPPSDFGDFSDYEGDDDDKSIIAVDTTPRVTRG
jgi:hypothetical protein